jgi:hypothetical protein
LSKRAALAVMDPMSMPTVSIFFHLNASEN